MNGAPTSSKAPKNGPLRFNVYYNGNSKSTFPIEKEVKVVLQKENYIGPDGESDPKSPQSINDFQKLFRECEHEIPPEYFLELSGWLHDTGQRYKDARVKIEHG